MTRTHGFLDGAVARLLSSQDGLKETVYAITDGHFIKIGKSNGHPVKRLAELQTGNPRVLTLLAYTRDLTEKRCHQLFAVEHHRGEWFHCSVRLLAVLATFDWVEPRWQGVINAAAELLQGELGVLVQGY